MEKKRAQQIYKIINGINTTLINLPSASSVVRDKSWERFNDCLAELHQSYNDDIFKDFLIQAKSDSHYNQFVDKTEYRSKVFRATLYLHEEYLPESTTPPHESSGIGGQGIVLHQSQDNSQNQSNEISIEFNTMLLQLSDVLHNAENVFPELESNENKYIKRIKQLLPTAKSSMELFVLIIKAADDFRISSETLLKIFGVHVH
jgi:hypothetical protein